jgi:hypothetical protein
MKVVYEYSHLGGSEILQVRYPDLVQEIYAVIRGVKARRTKISKEKTMRGTALFSPKDMNRQFLRGFRSHGYRELKDMYTITIPNSDVAIRGAFKQVDFVKGKVLVEVQFGKSAAQIIWVRTAGDSGAFTANLRQMPTRVAIPDDVLMKK